MNTGADSGLHLIYVWIELFDPTDVSNGLARSSRWRQYRDRHCTEPQ